MKSDASETTPNSTIDYLPRGNKRSIIKRAKLAPLPPYQPMPLHVLPPVLSDFIGHVSRVKDIEPAYVALPVLAVLSAAIGNSRRFQLRKDYLVPAVLWPVLVAESGNGKSPGMDAAMRPIIQVQSEAAKQAAADHAEYVEQMRDWKSAAKASRGDQPKAPPQMRHFYVDNATTEVVAVRLQETPRGLLCAVDEFAGLVGNFNAYKKSGGNDRESWLSFYDARAAKIDRKTSIPPTIYVPRAFVAATGTIQPSTLRGTLSGNMVGCGFAARLLLAMPPGRQRKWSDDEVSADVHKRYADLIAALYQLNCGDEPELIKPTEATMSRWKAWWNEREAERDNAFDPAVKAMLPKICDAAARLALILHCCAVASGEPGVIDDQLDDSSMAAGIELAAWFANEGKRCYAMLARDPESEQEQRLIDWIERRGGWTTPRDLHRSLRIYSSVAEAKAALECLVNAGVGCWKHEKPSPMGGRGVFRYMLKSDASGDADDETLAPDAAAQVLSASAECTLERSKSGKGAEDAA